MKKSKSQIKKAPTLMNNASSGNVNAIFVDMDREIQAFNITNAQVICSKIQRTWDENKTKLHGYSTTNPTGMFNLNDTKKIQFNVVQKLVIIFDEMLNDKCEFNSKISREICDELLPIISRCLIDVAKTIQFAVDDCVYVAILQEILVFSQAYKELLLTDKSPFSIEEVYEIYMNGVRIYSAVLTEERAKTTNRFNELMLSILYSRCAAMRTESDPNGRLVWDKAAALYMKVLQKSIATEVNKKLLNPLVYKQFIGFMSYYENPNVDLIFTCYEMLQRGDYFNKTKFPQLSSEVEYISGCLIDAMSSTFTRHKKLQKEPENLDYLHYALDKQTLSRFIKMFGHLRVHLKSNSHPWVKFFFLTYYFPQYLQASFYNQVLIYVPEIIEYFHEDENINDIFDLIFQMLYKSSSPNLLSIRKTYEIIESNKLDKICMNFIPYIISILKRVSGSSIDDLLYFHGEWVRLGCEQTNHEIASVYFDGLFEVLVKINPPDPSVALQLFNEAQNHCGAKASVYNHMIQMLAVTQPELYYDFPAELLNLKREYTAYQQYRAIQCELKNKWIGADTSPQCVRLAQKFYDEMEQYDPTLYPSEQLNRYSTKIETFNKILLSLDSFERYEKNHRLRAGIFYHRLSRECNEVEMNITSLDRICMDFSVEIERCKINELYATINMQTIWDILKGNDLIKIESCDRFLERYIDENPDEKDLVSAYIAKVKCLFKLGFHEKILNLLPIIKERFPHEHTRTLLMYWSRCCRILGQYTEAIAANQQILKILEGTPITKYNKKSLQRLNMQTKLQLARCHTLVGNESGFSEALAIYDQLILITEDEEERIEIELYRASCLCNQNELDAAESGLKSIDNWIENPHVLDKLGFVFYLKNDKKKSGHFYNLSLKYILESSDRSPLFFNTVSNCRKHFLSQRTRHMSKDNSIDVTINLLNDLDKKSVGFTQAQLHAVARNLIDKGDYQSALTIYQEMTSVGHREESVYLGVATCFKGLSLLDKAIDWLLQFPGYHENVHVLLQLAECYNGQGDFNLASETFEYLMETFPHYGRGYLSAMRYYIQLNQHSKVIECWEQCKVYCSENRRIIHQIKAMMDSFVMGHSETAPLPVKSVDLCAEEAFERCEAEYDLDEDYSESLVEDNPDVIINAHHPKMKLSSSGLSFLINQSMSGVKPETTSIDEAIFNRMASI